MQNASTFAKSSGRTQQHHQEQQISLVIIRIELDDLNLSDDNEAAAAAEASQRAVEVEAATSDAVKLFRSVEIVSSTEQLSQQKLANLSYNCRPTTKTGDGENSNKELFSEYSEKFGSREKTLSAFIGKRQSKFLIIETYHVVGSNSGNMRRTYDTQPLVTNAMTMQKALETAYKDWNKNKTSSGAESGDERPPAAAAEAATAGEQTLPRSSSDNESIKEKIAATGRLTKSSSVNAPDDESADSLAAAESHSSLPTTQTVAAAVAVKRADSCHAIAKPTAGVGGSSGSLGSSVSKLTPPPSTLEMPYYYGNPTVDIFKGMVHLYKDSNLTTIDDLTGKPGGSSAAVPVKRSEMLCILGIPASLTCNELLSFIMPAGESLQYIRIIRDSYPNRYMAVLKFKTEKEATLFYNYYNNREYNSIEENVCHLAFVERIEIMNSSKGGSLPIPGFTELPTCYICLERMDESLNGVITILCNHSFHANCLSKWGDTCCPVCRYSQTPEYSVDNTCTDCGSHENLWICLICGNVGCGRYVRGHAYDHFKLTQHTYSMELGHNRVWDYAADNYVHRLIQNKTDGKLVQFDEGGRAINQDEKVDSITLEYTYLLTSQLESQRLFFEDHIDKIEQKSKSQILELETKVKLYEGENTTLKESLAQLTKEKNAIEKKCSTLNTKLVKLQSDLEEEKEMNKCLTSNQEAYQSQLSRLEEKLNKSSADKDAEIKDLQAQLRDIMFYLDSQAKFNDSKDVSKEELQESQMIIQQDESQAGATASAKAASRRKKKK